MSDSTQAEDGWQTGRSTGATWFGRLAPWLMIAGLLLFHALNNWIWLTENVTLTGWDRPRHLAHSLNYARMLSPLTLRSLFEVMVSDSVRPPLFAASATIMYRLFGWSSDVATMVNVIYMAILLVATYAIGRKWGGIWLGLVSVALLACFPMFYAMSRYFYLEFALTAMVALTVWLLLSTEGFARRGMSLLFGLSLGLGLLTKRTFAVFALGPVVVVILGSGLLPALWGSLKSRLRVHWWRLLMALFCGVLLALVWYWPNRETVRTLILGDGLFVVWWLLATLAIYFVSLPADRLSNALAAFFLAAGLASTWYVARVEFVQRMALYGYGVNDPRGRVLELDRLDTYLFYLRRLANEHLSPVLFGLFLAAVGTALMLHLRRHASLRRALRAIRLEAWVVFAWVSGAYLLLTFSIYQETRAFTPVLPAIALIFGAALLKIPWRPLRWGLLAVALIFGLVQYLAVSYEPVNKLFQVQTGSSAEIPSLALPLWGETSVIAQGGYLELPDEGPTDRGYWIQPDILRRMEQRREEQGQEVFSLGLLARTRQINASAFIYLTLADYPYLRVEGLIDRFEDSLPYSRLFAHDYLVVKGSNVGTNPAQETVIQEVLAGSSPLFDEVFELETSYSLPDGDTVYLYRQRYYPPAGYPVEYVSRLAIDLSARTGPDDAILFMPAALLGPFAASYSGPAEIYLAPSSEPELAESLAGRRRAFLVLGDAAVSPASDAAEAQGWAEAWLNQHAFRAAHEWADSLQLVTYGVGPVSPATAPTSEVTASLGDQIKLAGYDLPAGTGEPGAIIPLTLFWVPAEEIADDYQVFVHLLSPEGGLVAQSDSGPVGGSRPTSSWRAGELIVDRHGLALPDTLPPGEYELRVGLYLPATGDRLPVSGRDGQLLSDHVPLGRLSVTPP
jgi:4-amino-4-deoxy-L-arabinose transferase-like glycosyltransferase